MRWNKFFRSDCYPMSEGIRFPPQLLVDTSAPYTAIHLGTYMKKTTCFTLIFAIVVLLLLNSHCFAAQSKEAEVIHWWVSGGESAALQTARDEFQSRGYVWVDTPVKDSYHAKTAVVYRMLDGNPPEMIQWHAGVALEQLYSEGLLSDITDFAEKSGWREVLPPVIWDAISVSGKVVAVPVTLHGSNWLWGNRQILDELDVPMVTSWQEFLAVAPKIQGAGYIPLALGGQQWQERNLFLSVLLAIGGPEVYKGVIVDHDDQILRGEGVIASFKMFRQLQQYIDEDSPGRSWNDTTALLIENKAAFQVMGDWAKGEFLQAKMEAGVDFYCSLTPGAEGHYLAVSDTFVITKVGEEKQHAQAELARVLMSPELQSTFNYYKGAIPPRNDADVSQYDACGKLAMKTVANSAKVLPGFNMANAGLTGSTIRDAISAFWNTPDMTPEAAAALLADSIQEVVEN